MSDGQQRDARVLGGLEDLSLHVDAHGAGTLVQQGVLGPDGQEDISVEFRTERSDVKDEDRIRSAVFHSATFIRVLFGGEGSNASFSSISFVVVKTC